MGLYHLVGRATFPRSRRLCVQPPKPRRWEMSGTRRLAAHRGGSFPASAYWVGRSLARRPPEGRLTLPNRASPCQRYVPLPGLKHWPDDCGVIAPVCSPARLRSDQTGSIPCRASRVMALCSAYDNNRMASSHTTSTHRTSICRNYRRAASCHPDCSSAASYCHMAEDHHRDGDGGGAVYRTSRFCCGRHRHRFCRETISPCAGGTVPRCHCGALSGGEL
jgi:hypothetical protein